MKVMNCFSYNRNIVMFEIVVCWVAVPCSVVSGYQHLGGPCCLHLQGLTMLPPSSRISHAASIFRDQLCCLHLQGSNMLPPSSGISHAASIFRDQPCCLHLQGSLQPWRWSQDSPPKCWYPTTTLHGAKKQKTWLFSWLPWRPQIMLC